MHLGWSQFAVAEYKVHAATQGKNAPDVIFFRLRPEPQMLSTPSFVLSFANANGGVFPTASSSSPNLAAERVPC
jgi:hypothetical protein